jgi:hypothetical protein
VAKAFGDYACGCQICCAAINENELFSLDSLRPLSHAEFVETALHNIRRR